MLASSLAAGLAWAQDHKTPSTLDGIQGAFSANPMLFVWLAVGIAFSYLIGWFVLRTLVKASEMPHDAGCAGCLGGFIVFGLIVLAILVMIIPVPDWIVWLVLFILFLVILITFLSRARTRMGPLLLLFLLLFGAFLAWKFLGPKLSSESGSASKQGRSTASVTPGDTEGLKDAVVLTAIPATDQSGKVEIGTGFYIDGSGTFLTCKHCVGDNKKIKVATHDKEILDADVVATDDSYDLALCTTKKTSAHFFALDTPSGVKVGEDVRTVGYPLGITSASDESTIDPTFSGPASIGAIRSPDLLQISGSVNHGNSGGPLYNQSTGKVVGIVAARNEESGAESIGWAVSVGRIEKFLKRNGR